MLKYFYVYYSYEEYGRGYIGSRICNCLPENDIKYFGSFKDRSFNPTQKIILETFDNNIDMLNSEVLLHTFYQVDLNPHFANKARQTSTGFSTFGLNHNENQKRINIKKWLGNNNPNRRPKEEHSFYGKCHTEIWKKEQSERMKNNNPMKRCEVSKKQSQSMKGKTPWNKGIKFEKYNDGGNPNAKKIIFNEKEYSSIKEAMKENQISYHMIRKNCIYLDR
jgi:hypothetical protein